MQNLVTSPVNRGVSADPRVERLFEQLAFMYGKHWLDMWLGMPMVKIKAEWSARLQRFPDQTIQMVLDHMHREALKFPPTLPEFAGLCEQFRPREAPTLYLADQTQGVPMPESVRERLAKLLNRQ